MSIWNKYTKGQRDEYIKFLQAYGALSNMFRQKKGDMIPYLDSKFQETIYSKAFGSQIVDIGNSPHDVLSIFGDLRVGIGLKTWMNSTPSFQKVMQLKKFQTEIRSVFERSGIEEAIIRISEIKNSRMKSDYNRLGLTDDKNIYHYVTRDEGQFVVNECSYPLINLNSLSDLKETNNSSALSWSDGKKEYKFTFADSQIWQKFDSSKHDSSILNKFEIKIIEDPFPILLNSYLSALDKPKIEQNTLVEVYLPLYSYQSKEVEEKSGLNAWNASSKNKGSSSLRPLNEIYIPIPREFHKKYPWFFTKNIFQFEENQKTYQGTFENKPEIRFYLHLPNGKRIPSLVTQSNMKALQSGSNTERDENGKKFGQSALGQWLLIDVLGLNDRKLVTRNWLQSRGTDSVRLWREKDDYNNIYIDFAPIGSFESFMNNEIDNNDGEIW
jgi:hypothetical protein